MTSKNYIIYDQEPAKRLLDVPITFLILLPLFYLIIKVLHTSSTILIIFIAILFVVALHIVSSLWAKYISANKLNIELSSEYLEISFFKKHQNNRLTIYLNEIIKTEDIYNNMRIADHFKIYYGDNKIFAISKSTHFFLLKDNFEEFKRDLKEGLKNKTKG
jgi:hypothetical protein